MYPIALEQQYSKLFLTDFDRYAKALLSTVRNSDELSYAPNLNKFKNSYTEDPKLVKKIEYQFELIKTWAIDKTNVEIAKIIERRLGETVATKLTFGLSPSVKRQTKQDATDPVFPTILIPEATSEQIRSLVNDYVSTNMRLSQVAKDEFFEKVQTQIYQGIRKGSSYSTITEEILNANGGIARSKAEFWARDQVGKFFGTATRLQQTGSGIQKYIWCCTHLNTRDQHLKLDNTLQSWDKRPKILYGSKTTECHPGEDNNCRCFARPAIGDEPGVKEWRDEWVAQSLDLTLNDHNTIIDVNNSLSKAQIVEALRSINSVLDIQPKTTKFRFYGIEKKHPEFQRASGFYDPETGDIYLKPGIDNAQVQIIHEVFHKLDAELLSRAGLRGHQTAEAAELMQAIRITTTFRELAKSKPLNPTELRDWAELSKESEWIARIFEQLVAFKTKDAKLLKQISTRLSRFEALLGYRIYLDQKELDTVLPLMQDYLTRTGLMR
ncbi:phage minor head protein [Leptospira interrogans]|uniref:phage minor head protein n=1 Tax=Leptospira interrogans TaxID=173 RepID=UPI00030DFF55|nr:phage minor head protein [Leptospira interrogans]